MVSLYSFSARLQVAKLALLSLLGLATLPALAQTVYTPVDITAASFTADVIADGAATAISSTTNGYDQGGTDVPYCLIGNTYVSPVAGAPTRSLPANRILQNPTSATPGLSFVLQPYSGLNSLRIAGTGSGTLTLAAPQSARSVWIAASTGNGAAAGNNPVTMTVNFTDGTTQVFSNIQVNDWFGGANYIANNLGRVSRTTDRYDNAANEPRIYQIELALLATNYNKPVSSVQFAKTQPSGVTTPTVFNGLAITLASVCSLPTGVVGAAPTSVCRGQSSQLIAALIGGGGNYTGQWQSSPDGVTWTDINGATTPNYTATPTVTTRYRYRTTCSATVTALSNEVTVTVVVPGATLAYSAANYCRTGTTGVPTVTPAGGTFTSAPVGLTLSPTGEINLAASAAGTYVVTYNSGGQCPASATFTLSVLDPVVTLAYNSATYCRSGTSGVPSALPAGGTFSAPAGLVLSQTTGDINLANSAAGIYTITYASGGLCSKTATARVEVKSDALPTFPNIVTPNGDGLNDALRLAFQYPADVTGFEMQVFNRWGRRVWQGTNPTVGWSPDQESGGVYYYIVDYNDCVGRHQHQKAWVQVVK